MSALDRPVLRAVVLAAGFATRLWPLTRDRAKPLLEVGGEPMLTRTLRQVAATGRVREVVVITNERFHGDFEAWCATLSTELELQLVNDGALDDEHRLGAIADLRLGLKRSSFTAPVDGWLVLAGDNLLDFELAPYLERFAERGLPQLLVRELTEAPPPHKYNEVTLDEHGLVRQLREKPADHQTKLASIGVYLLPPELPSLVDEYLDGGGAADAPGYLMEWLVARVPFEAVPVGGRWFDIGDRDDLEAARRAFTGE